MPYAKYKIPSVVNRCSMSKESPREGKRDVLVMTVSVLSPKDRVIGGNVVNTMVLERLKN